MRTTCSFARAERLLGREYHGRFLIELLQNAADAWRNDSRSGGGGSRVAVLVTEGPALLVANQGVAVTADVIISSLGHIGATTKAEGEAIGHKGVGFKSVLELSLTPEVYSGLRPSNPPALAVSFDPDRALQAIREATPDWDKQVGEVSGLDLDDPLAAVPVLRYPAWVDDPAPEVGELAEAGFDTVVRLPFDERFAARLGLDADSWLTGVRAAIADLSDEILLLLGTFDEVTLEDRLGGTSQRIVPRWDDAPVGLGAATERGAVSVMRNGQLSTRWLLYRRTLPDQPDLAGEIAVGMRIDESGSATRLLSAVGTHPSAPFHLFFPTRIASGLPFLLHGYFEVDAARTGFYRGSASRNTAILAELAALAAEAVDDVARLGAVDPVDMVDLIAEAGEPTDPLGQHFREQVLDRLDDVGWIPVEPSPHQETAPAARPREVFIAAADLTRRIGRAFPAAYVHERIGLEMPDPRLSDAALSLLADRVTDRPAIWAVLSELCRPGPLELWDGEDADAGFLALLDLLDALYGVSRSSTEALLAGLAGDPDSTLLPVTGAAGTRKLLPVPDPAAGVPGRRSQLVMARVRAGAGDMLVPPPDLDLAFLPDGLLASEGDVLRAAPLGVRSFTVDTVIDRLNGVDDARVDGEALLRFLWQLLARDGVSRFSTRRSAATAAAFDPTSYFWCRPGRAREDDTARQVQQRERYLAAVPVPCRDGVWRPAGEVVFGADWADWIAARGRGGSATSKRATAYRALEAIAPGSQALLAAPELILALLDDEPFPGRADFDETNGDEDLAAELTLRDTERHAFLLRLGVWEVPPLEAFESRDHRRREPFPWTDAHVDHQREIIERDGHRFGLHDWSGNRHHNTNLAEDYRLRWSLEAMAHQSPEALLVALRHGATLYGQRLRAAVFCPGCSDSKTGHRTPRESSGTDGYPSVLAIQLRTEPWVPASVDGQPTAQPAVAPTVWWHAKPPTGAGLRQSPWRLLPLCGPPSGVDETLRDLGAMNRLEQTDATGVGDLLVELREQFEEATLPVDPAASGSGRQAFEGLHRLAYERLAEIAAEDPDAAAAALARSEVLCHLGEGLVYRTAAEARHDDGRFSAYARHFTGLLPFAALPRDRQTTAARLGIPAFSVQLHRRGEDPGTDVTDDLRAFLGDRIAELLAIVLHHSLGTQTLDIAGAEFEERARRLANLRVIQVGDLIVDATAAGTEHVITIGEGADAELYLEDAVSAAPRLYHDLTGEGWQDRLRRKLAPHLATVLENRVL